MRTIIVSLCIASVINDYQCNAQNKIKQNHTTYEGLISVEALKLRVPAFKNRRARELESLSAMVIKSALDRIIDILGKQAQSSMQSIHAYVHQKKMTENINDYVRTAYSYAIADFNEQIKRDNDRHEGIGAITKLPVEQKNDLIKLELEELNERYTPIAQALKKLKPETKMPQELRLKAFEQFKDQ